MTAHRTIRDPRAQALQGARAGFVSRVTADAIDFGVLQVVYLGCLVSVAVVRFLIQRGHFHVTAPSPIVTVAVEWVLLVIYLGSGWSSTGRTVGKTALGLRVVTRAGSSLPPARAFARAVMCASFYPGLLWILVSRRNAALHDALFRTEVRYEWTGAPPATPPTAG